MERINYRGKVLVVDDDENVRRVLCETLTEWGLNVVAAESGGHALALLQDTVPDIILLDIKMPGMDGIEVLRKIKEKGIPSIVVMMTAYADISTAVNVMKLGAYEFITKPFKDNALISAINEAIEKSLTLKEVEMLQNEEKSLSDLMGKGSDIQAVIQRVGQVAKTDFTVFIEGETGTGKELIANAIHKQSKRHNKQLVVIDCGAIPETLIESELFGHERGAYTGANHKHDGYFFLANQGTLFLDEISNLSLSAQRKLLRVLEEKKIHPVGSEKYIGVDVRVIAASNVDLNKEAAGEKFRPDLYHRLKEFYIYLPPLRERKDDIFFLAERFIQETSIELGKNAPKLSSEAAECILKHRWPGNVRELRNTIRRSVLMADTAIKPEYLHIESSRYPAKEKEGLDADLTLRNVSRKATAEAEKQMIQEALKMSNGNKSEAARLLKIDYKTLYNKMKVYEI